MKDIPVFDTDDGVSSLTLKEIPYKQTAYIHVQDVQPGGLEAHLAECVSFCRMVGAERVYATGHAALERYPQHCIIFRMRLALAEPMEPTDRLWPVTNETVRAWRRICNEKMAAVDNAATMTSRLEKEILDSGGAYFVHDGENLLGIGWLRGNEIAVIAAVVPGAGERVLRTLASICNDDALELETASTNARAIRLYEKMGFIKTGEVSRWYKIR